MTLTHHFELVREQAIPELNATAQLYRHTQVGTQLLSIQADDENKVFGITFKTLPSDSTGLPHILEHSVLCGSRKYPVKDPFVQLIKGSLKTFVNAFTFPDKTVYPAASQNLQDFYNLIDVYLDAVFHPNLTPYTLKQEGWHYDLDDPDAPITFKGVVFNEMKGAYSDPNNLLARFAQQSLFPDNTYGVDSGGDPAVIPDLTFEQFMTFHETYYHPSNALVFFYGDDPVEARLRMIDEYVRVFEPKAIDAEVALQPRYTAPQRLTESYAVADDDLDSQKAYVTVNWLLAEGNDPKLALSFSILNHLLVGTPASPLRKALIDSGLGEDLTGGGLEPDLRELAFSTGLKGVAPENVDEVPQLLLDTLASLAESGIEQEMIDASVNTVEFALRENNTGPYPRGLLLMIRSLRTWLYGGDPLAPLAFEAPLNAIKAQLAAGEPVFERLISTYFLDNPHRTTVILTPDPVLNQALERAERARLDQARAAMSDTDIDAVIADTLKLREMQETPDSPDVLATIPMLQREDLDTEAKTIPLVATEQHGTTVLYHDLFTNGIVYLDLGFDLHVLPQEYVPYMGLFGRALLEMGTETEDFVRLSQRIGRATGGIYPTTYTSVMSDGDQAAAWGFLRGKATVEQTEELLAILRDILLMANLDNQTRFRQLVLEEKAALEAGLIPRGHIVARSRLQARFNEADWAAEQVGGVDYLFFLRQLAGRVDADWTGVLQDLEAVRAQLVNRRTMLCNVTVDGANWQQVEPRLGDFLGSLPAVDPVRHGWNPQFVTVDEGLTIPAQVNYVAKGARLYDLGYDLHGSVLPITNYLRATWLWERVRVHGGAYGGFCTFDRNSGMFAFLSYRDPNLLGTLENYDRTAQFLRECNLTDDELTKAIIGAIGTLDAYQLPDAKGYTSMARYLTNVTDAERQAYRDQVLGTTVEDFRRFADVLDRLNAQGAVVVLGAQDAIQKANDERGDWLTRVKVL